MHAQATLSTRPESNRSSTQSYLNPAVQVYSHRFVGCVLSFRGAQLGPWGQSCARVWPFLNETFNAPYSKETTASLSPRQPDQSEPAQCLQEPGNRTIFSPLFKKFVLFKRSNNRNSMPLLYKPLKYVCRKLNDYGTTSD